MLSDRALLRIGSEYNEVCAIDGARAPEIAAADASLYRCSSRMLDAMYLLLKGTDARGPFLRSYRWRRSTLPVSSSSSTIERL